MEYKIGNQVIKCNEFLGMYEDGCFSLKIITENETFNTDKKHKKEIEKLLNKKDLYISDNLTVYFNEIISMVIEENDDLIIFTKNNFIHVDKKYKKEMEKLMNKENLYIADTLTVYVNEIESMIIKDFGYLQIITKNNGFYTDKKHYNNIKTFNLRKKLENF